MNRWFVVIGVALLLAGCGGHSSGAPIAPTDMLPATDSISTYHADVVQTGTSPLDWTRFAPPDIGTYHTGMVAGRDGAMWFTDSGRGLMRITMQGQTTRYPLVYTEGKKSYHYYPAYVAIGSDGRFYMDESDGMTIASFAPPSDVKVFHLSDETEVSGLGVGPDGNVWTAALLHLVRVTPAGKVTYFPYPDHAESNIFSGITTGSDGNVWFTTLEPYQVANINPKTLAITAYSLPLDCQPEGIATGGDGNIYVGCPKGLIRVTTSGVITPLNFAPGACTCPGTMIEGPDGDIYFGTFTNVPVIGHVHVSTGKVEALTIPYHGYGISSQAAGPDGNIWDVDGQGYVNVYIRNVLDVAPSSLALTPRTVATVQATYSGSGILTATSFDPSIASVVPGVAANTFLIASGVAAGHTTVTISDGIGNSFNITVSVASNS